MIEEQCLVVAVESGAVWVEAQSKSGCPGCATSAGCGQGLLERLGMGGGRKRMRALSIMPLRVGDSVVVGMREEFLLRSALAVYLLPLLGLFVFAISVQQIGFGEPLVILAGFLGFAFVWILVRRASRHVMDDLAWQPVVLRALPGTLEGHAGRAAF
ncbi:SoxR reducing system RseC family protein [Azotobacter beijerinckii]|uniref:Positive regulator of sigma(E), RseC/MucC n=1 Tax=Azotobacter beijerinckii TaxID=170623 RepID=A0A1I4D614_9GAMM|nr:SoxR reducing system RseC family protein [Azotobacter beijerinckii]SFB34079.1 positive regulator of sigma(E), RseC/MucC [Azotobacter beijerinckii]SFK89174.1 positive regulator of sigma(E), RseC/MucC [Azotobacter beijerinckii]